MKMEFLTPLGGGRQYLDAALVALLSKEEWAWAVGFSAK